MLTLVELLTKETTHIFMSGLERKVNQIEKNIEAIIPKNNQARFKIFLDQFMPAALIGLGSLLTFNFLVTPTEQTSYIVNVLNVSLVSFFVLRFMLALSLAESNKEFLKEHWFDALLVLPALSLLREMRFFLLLESETEDRAILGFIFARSTTLSGQLAKMYTWFRRTLRL